MIAAIGIVGCGLRTGVGSSDLDVVRLVRRLTPARPVTGLSGSVGLRVEEGAVRGHSAWRTGPRVYWRGRGLCPKQSRSHGLRPKPSLPAEKPKRLRNGASLTPPQIIAFLYVWPCEFREQRLGQPGV